MKNLINFVDSNNVQNAYELGELLSSQYSIKMREDITAQGDKLFTLNYDQINSPKLEPIVRECRGIVLTEDLHVAAHCMERFYNLGEALEVTDRFNWKVPFSVDEKADGSIIQIYNYNDHWEIATRGTATGEVENYTGQTFRNMVIRALGFADEQDFQGSAGTYFWDTYTYIFEFTSPENRVVTPYTEEKLVLITIFNGAGEELEPSQLMLEYTEMMTEVRLPNTYQVQDREEVVKLANSLDGLAEGFVLKDINGLRIKVKAEAYVAVHKLRGDSIPTPKRIANLVVTNETEEYLAYFPEERARFTPYQEAWESLLEVAEDQFEFANQLAEQKEFALAIKGCNFTGAMFTARAKNVSFMHAMAGLRTNAKIDVLLGAV